LSGTLFLTVFMIIYRSFSRKFLKESFKLHWKPLLIIGITNPIIIFLYFENILVSGLAIAAFLLYTNGIFVLFFLIIGKVEKVAKTTIASFGLAIIGVALIMEFWTGQGLTYGVIIGILSGLVLGIQIFYMKKIYIYRKEHKSKIKAKGDINTLLAWWPTLFIIFAFLPFGALDLARLTVIDLTYVIVLGLLPTALAFVLYNIGVKSDKGGNIIILSYFEPVVATISGILILPLITKTSSLYSIYTIIGGSLILIANIIILISSRRNPNSEN